MEKKTVQYRVEYFEIGNGRHPNTVITIDTSRPDTTGQIADVLDQLKRILRKDNLKLDDIIVYKLTRNIP